MNYFVSPYNFMAMTVSNYWMKKWSTTGFLRFLVVQFVFLVFLYN